ncbi:MAG: hypothetical protein H8D22_09190 [Candidatus Cloacimonetes bacterium]|nr:hypothetical protein [Candidatus Cloacimonadota bacterium]
MKFKIIFILLTIFIAADLSAAFPFNRYTGEETQCFTARSLSMGSAGIANSKGALNALNNPAILGLLNNKLNIQFTTNITKDDEDRAYPIYDSFDSYIEDAVYVSNAHFFDKYFFGISYNVNFKPLRISAGYTYAPLYDFNFKYEEEVRNNENTNYGNEPKKIAINTYDGKGSINAHTPCIAMNLYNKDSFLRSLSVGAGISFLKGENEIDSTIIFTNWAKEQMSTGPDTSFIPDIIYSMKNEYSGIRFQGGMIIGLGDRIHLGFSYINRTEISKNYKSTNDTVWADTTIYYPSSMGFGLEYHPRNVWDTKFTIEAKLVKWSDYNILYDDIIEYSAGMEHITYNGIPIRLGFRYQPSGRNKEVTLTAFSAGTAIKLPYNFVLDLGIEIGKRNYQEKDLFPDGYYANEKLWDTTHNELPEDRENPDKVTNFMINAMTTISWRF